MRLLTHYVFSTIPQCSLTPGVTAPTVTQHGDLCRDPEWSALETWVPRLRLTCGVAWVKSLLRRSSSTGPGTNCAAPFPSQLPPLFTGGPPTWRAPSPQRSIDEIRILVGRTISISFKVLQTIPVCDESWGRGVTELDHGLKKKCYFKKMVLSIIV